MRNFGGLSSIIRYTIGRLTPSSSSVVSGNGGARCYSAAALSNEGRRRLRDKSAMDLSRRIWEIRDHKSSIVPVVDQWFKEGNSIEVPQFHVIIKELRYYRRHFHALQIFDWLANKSFYSLSSHDVAIRLDMITKVHGIEKAEDYFNYVSTSMKDLRVYGALLHCYSYTRSVEKAEALFQKMKELGFALTTMTYNPMLNLYCKTGNAVKADTLMEEMCQKHINFDRYTYSIRHSAYAAAIDINGMEMILTRMEADPDVVPEWSTYTIMSNGYKKVGLLDKALEMLNKSEGLIDRESRKAAYSYLMTQYAGLGKKDEVLRIWELYKMKEKVYNRGYLLAMSSLLKFDDIETAEKIFEEWESRKLSYDIRFTNVLLSAYARKGLLVKAETLLDKAISNGGKPSGMSYYNLATAYLRNDQSVKAVEAVKKALMEPGLQPFKLSYDFLAASLDEFKANGELEKAEDFIELLRDNHFIPPDIGYKLLNHIESSNSYQLDVRSEDGDTAYEVDRRFMYQALLQAYAALSKIEEMKKILTRMESDRSIVLSWRFCTIVVKLCSQVGLQDKALEMLKKSEGLVDRDRFAAYKFLMGEYARLGNKDGFLRIWDLYKKEEGLKPKHVRHVLSFLLEVDDVENAERVVEEWKSLKLKYDMKIPGILVSAYIRKGFLEKAETLVNWEKSSGLEPCPISLFHLALAYVQNDQPRKAAETMKKIVSQNPNYETLSTSIECLKGDGDEKAECFIKLLKNNGFISAKQCKLLGKVSGFRVSSIKASPGGSTAEEASSGGSMREEASSGASTG